MFGFEAKIPVKEMGFQYTGNLYKQAMLLNIL